MAVVRRDAEARSTVLGRPKVAEMHRSVTLDNCVCVCLREKMRGQEIVGERDREREENESKRRREERRDRVGVGEWRGAEGRKRGINQ